MLLSSQILDTYIFNVSYNQVLFQTNSEISYAMLIKGEAEQGRSERNSSHRWEVGGGSYYTLLAVRNVLSFRPKIHLRTRGS